MAKLKMIVDSGLLSGHGTAAPIAAYPVSALAALMVNAYEGTPDWEDGDDESVAASEIEATLDGSYGAFVEAASGVISDETGKPVSAIFVSLYEEQPTILFVFTAATHTRTGKAESLIRRAGRVLSEQGFDRLVLYVSEDNPARRLYERLGFRTEAEKTLT